MNKNVSQDKIKELCGSLQEKERALCDSKESVRTVQLRNFCHLEKCNFSNYNKSELIKVNYMSSDDDDDIVRLVLK